VKSRIYSMCRMASGFGFAFLLSLFACADGGVGGTGISSVQGNVLEVEPQQGSALGGIVVRELTTGQEDTTTEKGEFRLVGRFPVEMTLLFFPPSAQEPATVGLTVPPGSELTLENVRVEDATAVPERIRAVLPLGEVLSDANCEEAGGSFELELDDLVFEVLIDSHTDILAGRTCARDLTGGTLVKVDGVQDGLTITATKIDIVKSGTIPGP
jgi:hypothetical protein